MEFSRKEENKCNKVFDMVNRPSEGEEKKLELRLGPPDVDWSTKDGSEIRGRDNDSSNMYLGKRVVFLDGVNGGRGKAPHFSPFLLQSPQPGDDSSNGVDLNTPEKKASASVPHNTSQKRAAPSQVVGWPPLRSFRKNLASSSSLKPNPESQDLVSNKFSSQKPVENNNSQKGFFVKINMDGIPIGRKVDLTTYDSYEKLASAVNELFKDLLAAQSEGSNREKAITGLLDGNGEYTLVYEDNEGDMMLVGDDVHWQMFVSNVKRLRVLKSSELSKLSCGNKQVKL